MKRREFVTLLGGLAAASPLAARAQQPMKVPTIGYIAFGILEARASQELLDAFRHGLREHGYVEGQNIVIEFRAAEQKTERLPSLAAELVRLKVDVIVAFSTAAARAAQQATTTIPILCFLMGDPIGEQLVTSLARPGGNVTGFTVLAPELVPKCLALLKEAMPKVSRVAALWQPDTFTERTTGNILQSAEAAAGTFGIELQLVSVPSAKDLDGAFTTMVTGRADALLVLPGPLSFAERQRIADLAALHRLPSVSWNRVFVEVGGLLSYGVNYNNQVRVVRNFHDPFRSLIIRRSMSRIMARMTNAAWDLAWFSKSLVRRRHRPSQPNVRSTIQRLGSTTKPLAASERLTISSGMPASARTSVAVAAPW